MKVHCKCGWSAPGIDQVLFLEHQNDVISDFVGDWIEFFCEEVSQLLTSHADMIEDGSLPIAEVIESLRQNAENYSERAEDMREDGIS